MSITDGTYKQHYKAIGSAASAYVNRRHLLFRRPRKRERNKRRQEIDEKMREANNVIEETKKVEQPDEGCGGYSNTNTTSSRLPFVISINSAFRYPHKRIAVPFMNVLQRKLIPASLCLIFIITVNRLKVKI